MGLIRNKVAEMGAFTENALKVSLRALAEGNRQLAYSVILRDQYLDERETELNQLCLEFLVRHQPVAGQLRFVFTAIQINKELERIGDYAESIARQVLAVSALEPQPPCVRFTELGNLSVGSVADVAVLRLQKGEYGFTDMLNTRFDGTERLICELTIKDGKIVS